MRDRLCVWLTGRGGAGGICSERGAAKGRHAMRLRSSGRSLKAEASEQRPLTTSPGPSTNARDSARAQGPSRVAVVLRSQVPLSRSGTSQHMLMASWEIDGRSSALKEMRPPRYEPISRRNGAMLTGDPAICTVLLA